MHKFDRKENVMTNITLKKWRERNGWSLFQAALVLNIAPERYESIENGSLTLTQNILDRCKTAGLIHAIQKTTSPDVSIEGSPFAWIIKHTHSQFGDPVRVYNNFYEDLCLLTGSDLTFDVAEDW